MMEQKYKLMLLNSGLKYDEEAVIMGLHDDEWDKHAEEEEKLKSNSKLVHYYRCSYQLASDTRLNETCKFLVFKHSHNLRSPGASYENNNATYYFPRY